jgi:uncharacterized iron-regulated membrane protein
MTLPGRPFWVIVHRWAGLTLALFLAVAGLTGSLLPWFDELDAATAPAMQNAAPPRPGQAPLDPLAVRAALLARHPAARVDFVYPPARTAAPTGSMPRGSTRRPDWSAPTGPIGTMSSSIPGRGGTGHRRYGAIRQGVKNLMPFLYQLHSLALGPWGLFAMGLAALVWTLDCFVGFYLTLPPGALGKGVPAALAACWKLRYPSTGYKLTFDLHRAGGLWLWPILLVFALSSVSFNLPQVYRPALTLLGGQDSEAMLEAAALPCPRWTPALDFLPRPGAAPNWLRRKPPDAVSRCPAMGAPGCGMSSAGLYVYGVKSSADDPRRRRHAHCVRR